MSCSVGLATLASAKQAHANPRGTLFSQGWNNHVPSLTVRKPLLIHCQSELLTIAHAEAEAWCHCSLATSLPMLFPDWVPECGLGMKQVFILHECLQRCKLWSVITQCWSRPTITDYHGQTFGFEQPCMLSDLKRFLMHKCTDICSWFYKHHGLYY